MRARDQDAATLRAVALEIGVEADRAVTSRLARAMVLLDLLLDPDPCQLDHEGFCQAHGCSTAPCVQQRIREFLAEGR